jgi:stalled ribosome rescue protein Dom34
LCSLSWTHIEPSYLARLEALKDKFHAARSRQTGSADLSDVAKAAVSGSVETLLVEADRVIPGVLDRTTGSIRAGNSEDPHVDDMLDDLAELVLAKGGEVVVVPTERMPAESGLAAIFRF